MYKLVIADDELFIRESLSLLVNWEKLGFQLVEVFSDGQELLDYIDYMPVDVVLTDIKMGYTSGVEIAKYLSENGLPCKILFISGYREFDLAMKAMEYGVSDYLLKPVSVDTIEETFTKIREELDAQRIQSQNEQLRQKRLTQMLPIIKEKFISDLILGVVGNRQQILSRMELLYPQIDAEKSCCILLDVTILNYQKFIKEEWKYSLDQFEESVTAFINQTKEKLSLNIVYKSNDSIKLFGILTDCENNSQSICVQEMDAFLKNLSAEFGFHTKYEIKGIFKNIFEVAEYRNNFILRDKDNDMKYLQEQKKLIMSDISNHNVISAQKVFHNILDELYKANFLWKNEFIVETLSVLCEVVKKMSPELGEEIHNYINYSAIMSMNGMEQIQIYCDRIFDKMRTEFGFQKSIDNNTLVYNAQQYIKNNILEDISQEQVANELYVSSAYLCRIFKKCSNENFSQYIMRMKMEKAMELLKDPRYKGYQVAEVLGYKTPKYFSKLFKQYCGISPREYRGQFLSLEEAGNENL